MVARIPHMVAALVIILGFWVFGRVMRRVVRAAARRARLEPELVELFGTTTSVLISIFGVLVGFVVVFPDFAPKDLIAGVGLTSVAVGFAFKDILQNFFAGIFILWRRPFHIGDEIRTANFEGTVEEINMRATRLRTYDGERVIIPNTDVYTKAIQVRTAYPTRRVRFTVRVADQEAVEEVRSAIERALRETEGVMNDPGPWIYVSDLADTATIFEVYFWTGSKQANVLAVTNRMATRLKLEMDRAGFENPYPRTVVFLHDPQGRDGKGSPWNDRS